MKGTYVDLSSDDGGKFRGYLSLPETKRGPGLVLLQEIFGINENMRAAADHFAQEGYIAIVPDLFWRIEPGIEIPYSPEGIEKARALGRRIDLDLSVKDILATASQLKTVAAGVSGKVGVLGFCLGGLLAFLTATRTKGEVTCAVSYYGVRIEEFIKESEAIHCPLLFHFGAKDLLTPPEVIAQLRRTFQDFTDVDIFVYPEAGHGFSSPLRPDHYHQASAKLAHQRSLGLLRSHLGPKFDLGALWDKFCSTLFAERKMEQVIGMMVDDPCLHFGPPMMGGEGRNDVVNFFRQLLKPENIPGDFKMELCSRQVTSNTVVDESEVSFTHDVAMRWMLPHVAPTGQKVAVKWVILTKFRGSKISRVHVHWDQASVLNQLGLLKDLAAPRK